MHVIQHNLIKFNNLDAAIYAGVLDQLTTELTGLGIHTTPNQALCLINHV